MKKFFKSSKLVMVFLLIFTIATFFVVASPKEASAANYTSDPSDFYTISYNEAGDGKVTILLNPNISVYGDFHRADLEVLKDVIRQVVINVLSDDVDLSQYGVDPAITNKNKIRKAPTLSGPGVDVSLIQDLMDIKLNSEEAYSENFLAGTKYDLLLKYYVDRYQASYVADNIGVNKNEVLDEIQEQLVTTLQAQAAVVYTNEEDKTAAQAQAATKITSLINEVKALAPTEKVEIDLNDVVEIVNVIDESETEAEQTQMRTIICDYINTIDVKTEVNNIIMNSTVEDMTNFFMDVNVDTLIKTVKDTEILDNDNLTEIMDTIGIDNIIEIAKTASIEKLVELADAVDLTRENLKDIIVTNLDDITVASLMKVLETITIDGNKVFENKAIVLDGLKDFLKELPRPSEIATWTDEQMKLSWCVELTTTFGDSSFVFEIGFDISKGNCDNIRKLCEVLSKTFSINKINGVWELEFNTSNGFGQLVSELLENDAISENLKQRVFADMSLSIGELYTKFNNTTLEEYIALLKEVDYKTIASYLMDADRVSDVLGVEITEAQLDRLIDTTITIMRKVEGLTYEGVLNFFGEFFDVSVLDNEKLENLFNVFVKTLNKIDDGEISASKIRNWVNDPTSTNEKVFEKIDKLANYQTKFDELKEKVTTYYNKLPEKYTSVKVVTYYVENGSFVASANFNIDNVLSIFPSEVKSGLNVIFDRLPESVNVKVTANLPKFYQVTYVVGSESKVGYLPAGVNVMDYPGITEVNSVALDGWADANNNIVNAMPEQDITLYPVVEYTVSTSANVSKVYDGEDATISVTCDPTGTYTYQWYKDGTLIADATNASYNVKNVADSGTYSCKVTSEFGVEATSEDIEVSITKAPIDTSSYVLDNTSFTYDGNAKTVDLSATIDAKLTYNITNNSYTDAGSYKANVTYTIKSEYQANYEFAANASEKSYNWAINKAKINVSGYTWDYTSAFTYDGDEKTVALVISDDKVEFVSATNDKKTNAGSYQATATVKVKDAYKANYELEGTVPKCSWVINKAKINVSGYTWNYTNAFTFDYESHTVALNSFDEKVNIAYEDNEKMFGGTYTAKATATVKSDYSSNYQIEGTIANLEWKINAITVTKADFTWDNNKVFTYDGNKKDHKLVDNDLLAYFSYTYKTLNANNVAASTINAGTYTVTFSKFAVVNSYATSIIYSGDLPSDTLTINPASVDVSGYEWQNVSYKYDETEKSIQLSTKINEDFTVAYEDNKATDAGTYTAKATFTSISGNYTPSQVLTKEWSIAQETINVSGITWKTPTVFTYDGIKHTMKLVSVDPMLDATYDGNVQSAVGQYTATVTFTVKAEYQKNYKLGTVNAPALQWEIKAGVVDTSIYAFDYANPFVYDGQSHKIVVLGVDTDKVDVAYTNNEFTDAGKYTAKAVFTVKDKYKDFLTVSNSEVTAEWEIETAKVDISNYAWKNVSATYEYSGQAIEAIVLANEIDSKLNVVYTFNNETNAGNYAAHAEIALKDEYKDNYELVGEVADFNYTINPKAINVSGYTWTTTTSFNYDGASHEVKLTSEIDPLLEAHYSNNVKTEAGEYTAGVSFTLKAEAGKNYVIKGITPYLSWSIVNNEPTSRKEFEPFKNENGEEVVIVVSENEISTEYDLNVSEVSDDYKEKIGLDKDVIVYDIHFEKDGVEEGVNGKFKVRMLIPENLRNKKKIAVIHIDDSNKITYVDFERDGSYVVFDASEFSLFAVVEVKEEINIILVIILAVLTLGAIILFIAYFKSRKQKEDGNINPFFIKLASCKKNIQEYYYELKKVVTAYGKNVTSVMNNYAESFSIDGKEVASIEVKNAKLVVKSNGKTVKVNNDVSLNTGKKALRKAVK